MENANQETTNTAEATETTKKTCYLSTIHAPGFLTEPAHTVLMGFFTTKDLAKQVATWGQKEYYLKGKHNANIVVEEVNEEDIPAILDAHKDEEKHKRSLSYLLQHGYTSVYSCVGYYMEDHLRANLALSSMSKTK